MTQPVPLLLCFLLLLACQQPGPVTLQADTSQTDNSATNVKTYAGTNPFATTLEEVIKMFDDTVTVDTTFYRGNDTIAFSLVSYADRGKTISLPERYAKLWGLSSYEAPVFISTVHLTNNSLHLLDPTYDHGIFDDIISPEWKGLAVLLGPTVKFDQKYINLSYSLSIPLTDVGALVHVRIDYNGALLPQEL